MWCGRLQSLDTKNVNLDRQEISSFSALYKKKNGDCVLFVVTDRGGGINEDEIDKIMEPFYRSEKNINSIRGFGLGLTITKKIRHDYLSFPSWRKQFPFDKHSSIYTSLQTLIGIDNNFYFVYKISSNQICFRVESFLLYKFETFFHSFLIWVFGKKSKKKQNENWKTLTKKLDQKKIFLGSFQNFKKNLCKF